MAERISIGWQRQALMGLCWMLAASFIVGGFLKFTSFASYPVRFVDWGYPPWFRFAVGGAEVVCGVLLFVPRMRFLAVVLILIILEGAIVTHVVNHHPLSESIAAPVVMLLTAVVAWASAPWPWRALWGYQPRSLSLKASIDERSDTRAP